MRKMGFVVVLLGVLTVSCGGGGHRSSPGSVQPPPICTTGSASMLIDGQPVQFSCAIHEDGVGPPAPPECPAVVSIQLRDSQPPGWRVILQWICGSCDPSLVPCAPGPVNTNDQINLQVQVFENLGDPTNMKGYTAIFGVGDMTVDLTQFAPARGDFTYGDFWGTVERGVIPPEVRTISSGSFEAFRQ